MLPTVTDISAFLPAGSANTALAQAEAALAAAYDSLDQDDAGAAARHLERALALDPAFPEANGAMAEILAAEARFDEAAERFARALEGDPGRVAWHRGLAASLEATGRTAEAAAAARTLLERRPDDAVTHRRLARLLARTGDVASALEHAWEARFLDSSLSALVELADVFIAAGEPMALAELLEPALRRVEPDSPDRGRGLVALGRAWMSLAETEKARTAFRAALEMDEEADPYGAGPMLQALEAQADGELTPAFVRALFDRYADRFDADLVGKLKYGAPQALRQALERLGLTPGAGLRILDAGCGTGLAGVELRPFAGHLAGVDLAPRMVEKARARRIYDELSAGDLVATFQAGPEAWDLIVAADVMVYIGNLVPVLENAARALTSGGRVAFTCERGEGDGYLLHEGRRYAHGEGHVRAAALAAGLEIELLEDVVPRWDRGQPVPGMLVVLRRP